MTVRYQADADLNQAIVTGVLRRESLVDFQTAFVAGLQGVKDPEVLAIAAQQERILVINRWEPTSQICFDCGYRWGKLDLKVRAVTCLSCGSTHNRDENAAKNIEKVGIGHCHDSKRAQRAGKTGSPAQPGEASRITAASAR